MPDVSRSYRRPYSGINSDRSFLENLFNRPRKTSLLPFPDISDLDVLVDKESYDRSIKRQLLKVRPYKYVYVSIDSNNEI